MIEELLVNKFNHVIKPGNYYIKCQYYKKVKEGRLKMVYKLQKDLVFVHPAQVLSPLQGLI